MTYVRVYRWRVAPDREAAFIQAWSAMTRAIYQRRGSLGSRLHSREDGTFVAVAHWPSKATWEAAWAMPSTAAEDAWRAAMQANATLLQPDEEWTLLDDQVAAEPHRGEPEQASGPVGA